MSQKTSAKKASPAKARRKRKRRPGQPTAYNTKIVAKILELARVGKTELEIAKAVGVCEATISNWKNAHPEFLAALKKAKDSVDDLVEQALQKRAQGFTHETLHVRTGKNGKKYTIVEREYFPPDTTAGIFWLKNRRRKEWTDVQRRELTGADGGPIQHVAPQVIVSLPANGREAPGTIDAELIEEAKPSDEG